MSLSLHLEDLSKQYYRQWIFRNLTATLHQGEAWAITGPNGSGKSTLMAILMGLIRPTKGTIRLQSNQHAVPDQVWYRHFALAAPYQELIEEFTLRELLEFHFRFKRSVEGLTTSQLMDRMYLTPAKNKPIKYFSSGMKQRLKLGLAFFSQCEIMLLDEPTSNLDQTATDWYHEQLNRYAGERLTVIASNQPDEYRICSRSIHLADFNKNEGIRLSNA